MSFRDVPKADLRSIAFWRAGSNIEQPLLTTAQWQVLGLYGRFASCWKSALVARRLIGLCGQRLVLGELSLPAQFPLRTWSLSRKADAQERLNSPALRGFIMQRPVKW